MKLFILIIFISILLFSLYMLYRNDKVFTFKTMLNDKSYKIVTNYLNSIPSEDYNSDEREKVIHLRDIWFSITDISYHKMMWCFWKPLKEKYWLNKEQIDFLSGKY